MHDDRRCLWCKRGTMHVHEPQAYAGAIPIVCDACRWLTYSYEAWARAENEEQIQAERFQKASNE